MVAHKTQAIVDEKGQILVQGVPFKPGDRVEIIVLEQPQPVTPATRFPLPGPYRFDDPFAPVAADDWDAAKP